MPLLKVGPEFLVNVITSNAQFDSDVALLSDGRFVVAYRDTSGTDGEDVNAAVRARIFNADGTPSSAEFRVNATVAGVQSAPSVAALSGGAFVVSWSDTSNTAPDTEGGAIRARVFNASGSQIVPEFVVNATTANTQSESKVETLSDGRFIVSYTDFSTTVPGVSNSEIRARIFNADGTQSVAEFPVNTTATKGQTDSTITPLSGGEFMISWTDESAQSPDTAPNTVRARIFNGDGTEKTPEFLVNSTIIATQFASSLATLADGRIVATYTDASRTGGDTGVGTAIRGRIFNPDSTQSVAEFLVNQTVQSSQTESCVTGLSDGRFVVTYTDSSATGSDTSSFAIRARVFNADGTPSLPEFVVNTTVQNDQVDSAVKALTNGTFVVTWSDGSLTGLDTSGSAVRGQVFDPTVFDGTSVGDTVTGGSLGDRYSGLDGNDAMDGRAGNDTLDGGAGNDFLTGGAGNDSLNGGADFDYANYLDASSTAGITVSLAVTTAQNTGGAGTDTLTSIEGIYGSNFGDTLTGDNAPVNALYGWGGADSIVGNGGFDYVEAGEGDDTMDGGAGDDFLLGGNGIDTLTYASAGAAVYVDMSGASAFANGTASGFDVLSGVERVIGSGFGDFLFGSAGADTLVGGNGIDILYGFGLGDSLDGGDDTDYIVGGAGADTITSGAGQDYIYFQGQTEGKDTITDWRAGGGFDLICIDEPQFGGGLTINQYLSDAGNANRFVAGTAATAAIGQFLWNSATSTLSWDADGTGAGAAVQLVTLTGITSLTAGDILVL